MTVVAATLTWRELRDPSGISLPHTVRERLRWYENNARYQRNAYYVAEVAGIGLSAAIPLAAALRAPEGAGAILGALVVVIGGLRHLYRWGENWIRSNRTLVDLEAEVTKWSQGIAPYGQPSATAQLVDKVEQIVVGETSMWATALQAGNENSSSGSAD